MPIKYIPGAANSPQKKILNSEFTKKKTKYQKILEAKILKTKNSRARNSQRKNSRKLKITGKKILPPKKIGGISKFYSCF